MKKILLLGMSLCMLIASCGKEFLEEKPNKALLVPTTFADFQALLDNTLIMNVQPGLDIIAGDEFYTTGNGSGYSAIERNTYFWADDIYEATTAIGDWVTPYRQIFHANIVLDGLIKLAPNDNSAEYNRIKGSALFYRGCAAYNLAQLFTAPYNVNKATSLPGLPFPLSSNVNIRPGRGTLQETYSKIISDITMAANLLPINAPFKSRPTKPAAFALLARIYLAMQVYDKAGFYANECLKLYSKLIDYNTLSNTSSPFPSILPNGNDEVIYYSERVSYAFFTSTHTKVNQEILDAYANNDLRKKLFFNPSTGRFRGYRGITVDEMYLIRAESYCRNNDIHSSTNDLNTLLIKRFSGTYTPVSFTSKDDLLEFILLERRKELFYRGLRWSDLRRLNQDDKYAVTIKRIRDGSEIILHPNSNKYTFPIPASDLGEGVEQNSK